MAPWSTGLLGFHGSHVAMGPMDPMGHMGPMGPMGQCAVCSCFAEIPCLDSWEGKGHMIGSELPPSSQRQQAFLLRCGETTQSRRPRQFHRKAARRWLSSLGNQFQTSTSDASLVTGVRMKMSFSVCFVSPSVDPPHACLLLPKGINESGNTNAQRPRAVVVAISSCSQSSHARCTKEP